MFQNQLKNYIPFFKHYIFYSSEGLRLFDKDMYNILKEVSRLLSEYKHEIEFDLSTLCIKNPLCDTLIENYVEKGLNVIKNILDIVGKKASSQGYDYKIFIERLEIYCPEYIITFSLAKRGKTDTLTNICIRYYVEYCIDDSGEAKGIVDIEYFYTLKFYKEIDNLTEYGNILPLTFAFYPYNHLVKCKDEDMEYMKVRDCYLYLPNIDTYLDHIKGIKGYLNVRDSKLVDLLKKFIKVLNTP